MNNKKHEFCSDDWVKATRDFVITAAQGADLGGIRVSFNEVFTKAPSHIGANDEGLVGWFIRVEDGVIEVGKGILDQADLRITADYNTVVPLARTVGRPPLRSRQWPRRLQTVVFTGKAMSQRWRHLRFWQGCMTRWPE